MGNKLPAVGNMSHAIRTQTLIVAPESIPMYLFNLRQIILFCDLFYLLYIATHEEQSSKNILSNITIDSD